MPSDHPPYVWWRETERVWLVHDGHGNSRCVAELGDLNTPQRYGVTGHGGDFAYFERPTLAEAQAGALASLPPDQPNEAS